MNAGADKPKPQTIAERLAEMRVADRDPSTAAPIIIAAAEPDTLTALAMRLGTEMADRRYLAAAVEHLIGTVDVVVHHLGAEMVGNETTPDTESYFAGAKFVQTTLRHCMNASLEDGVVIDMGRRPR